MEFRFSPEDETFREELADFIDRELPWDWRALDVDAEEPDHAPLIQQFRRKLAHRGWLTMAWPREYGGSAAPHLRQLVFNEETAYRRVPATGMGVNILAPVLMIHGTSEQKRFFLNKIAQADIDWAQGYSEADAGSDLASLQTTAVEDGDDFVVSGAKLWNGAHNGAGWMFMLVRTDPDAPKHRGISFLLAEMDSPGISVSTFPMMYDGSRSLVTFDDVRVPKHNLVGEKNQGWYVGAASLDFERSGVGVPARAKRFLEEMTARYRATGSPNSGPWDDTIIRHRIADMAVEIQACRLMCYNVAWKQSQGLVPNQEASVVKLLGTEMEQRLFLLGMRLLGLWGQIGSSESRAPLEGRIENGYRRSLYLTVYGGTSEIQRNIIATRGLGLPRN